jgi:ferric iron reductase protein FhuF
VPSAAELAKACGLPWLPVEVGPPPGSVDAREVWHRFAELTDEPALATQVEAIRSECEGHRDIATAFLAGRFAWPLARLAVIPAVTAGRALLFRPPQLWIRQDARGLLTAVRIDAESLATDDAGSGAHARSAALAVEGYRPLVEGLRRVGRLGTRALWGQLADAVTATVGAALGAGGDPATATRHAELLLRSCDPPLWVRPEYAAVAVGGTPRLVWRRGSCCLAYRLEHFGLCTTCPLWSRTSWLEASARGGA